MRLNNYFKLILWIVLFQTIGFLLGLLTQANIHPWYESLNKSSLTPPGLVFSIVWTLLYTLLALIAWILSNQNKESPRSITYLYAAQIVMNWAWTPIFFQLHWLSLSAIWLIALTCFNLILIKQALNKQKTIALLLIPYVFWLIFASYLNVAIAFMN